MRYNALIRQTLIDIAADHQRPGSKERPEIMIEGARTYHISLSRTNGIGRTVKDPSHLVLYRHRQDSTIEIDRILHDSRDLARHHPDRYNRTDVGN